MNRSISDFLPDFFPINTVKETDTFTYETYQTTDGFVGTDNFTLSKAPIDRVVSVETKVDESSATLEGGVDYRVSNDNNRIEFIDGGKKPDPDATITVEYIADSVMGRILDSIEGETEEIESNIEFARKQKNIETASGDSLDRIGKLFGAIGNRVRRDDEDYRQYLKGLGKAYDSQGTKSSVGDAAAVVVSSPENNITRESIDFKEYFNRENHDVDYFEGIFDNEEYSVKINEFTEHSVSQLSTVLEVTDPSGVRFVGPIYNAADDNPEFTEGPAVTSDNIQKVPEYDTPANVPSSFIYPIGQEYTGFEIAEIFAEDVELDERDTDTFEWAEQEITISNTQTESDWNTFQWDDDDWSGSETVEWEINGDDWNFADWNIVQSR